MEVSSESAKQRVGTSVVPSMVASMVPSRVATKVPYIQIELNGARGIQTLSLFVLSILRSIKQIQANLA